MTCLSWPIGRAATGPQECNALSRNPDGRLGNRRAARAVQQVTGLHDHAWARASHASQVRHGESGLGPAAPMPNPPHIDTLPAQANHRPVSPQGRTETSGTVARIDCLSMILDEDIAERDNFGWRVEPATPDPANPLIEPRMPWDQGAVFAHGTFLKDPIDGLWKGWHVCTPQEGRNFEAYRRLVYSVSEDGVNWTRPELDLNSYPGPPQDKHHLRLRLRRLLTVRLGARTPRRRTRPPLRNVHHPRSVAPARRHGFWLDSRPPARTRRRLAPLRDLPLRPHPMAFTGRLSRARCFESWPLATA